MTQYGQHPDPILAIAHLSDTHLRTTLQYGVIDTLAQLHKSLERLGRLTPVPRALVFTGDLADVAEPESYRELRSQVEPLAAEMGAEVIWVMGNHDERAAYSRELFDDESELPQDRVHDIDGVRIIAMDSTVPGWHHGELDDAQLDWLREVLAAPAPRGTILALHHPPIPSPMVPMEAFIELRDQHRLAEVIEGTDVRAIVAGHYHHTSHSTFAGVPVSVASATCYTLDVAPIQRLISSIDAFQSFNMIHVYEDRLVTTMVPVDDAVEIHGYGEDLRPLLEAMSREEQIEMVSRKDSPLNAMEGQIGPVLD